MESLVANAMSLAAEVVQAEHQLILPMLWRLRKGTGKS